MTKHRSFGIGLAALHVILALCLVAAFVAIVIFDDERDEAKRRTAIDIALGVICIIVLRVAIGDLASSFLRKNPEDTTSWLHVMRL
jgi:hypothetical protein